ncbi:MAG TPA: hypothetical protein VM682_07015 [Bacillus sp. (in: firmicutes)]|jgi:hypothetical protein|nr:hypothetical protein [Bacillus sp. (in: firmicutes)]
MNKTAKEEGMVAFLQDNLFMGFVEPAGAEVIKSSARDAGFEIEDNGLYFNVVYSPIQRLNEVVVN